MFDKAVTASPLLSCQCTMFFFAQWSYLFKSIRNAIIALDIIIKRKLTSMVQIYLRGPLVLNVQSALFKICYAFYPTVYSHKKSYNENSNLPVHNGID